MKKNCLKVKRGKVLLNSIIKVFYSNMRIPFLVICLYIFGMCSISAQSPVAANGKLSVSGTQLVNENGIPVQLRGMSSHGLQWFTHEYNFNSLSVLANDWGIDVFRIAMYPSTIKEDYTVSSYDGNPEYWKRYIDHLVDICGQLGIYCIIDWHVLNPGDPNDPLTLPLAQDFWDYMSKTHAGKKHVLYELCNEPNGVNWSKIKTYVNTIIPIIRNNDPSSIIIVGTPNWDQDVDIAANDPIMDPVTGNLAPNVMYSLHFYADSHRESYRNKADIAISKGLALFVTEFGTMNFDGNGASNWVETDLWLDFLQKRKISWCNWQYGDKDDSKSSVLQPCSGYSFLWNNTNEQGDSLKKFIANPSDAWDYSLAWKPAVDIASPIGGEYFLSGQTVFLKANATEEYGFINTVDFYVDGVKVGTASSPDFTLQWKPSSVKDIAITAVAIDSWGKSSLESTPVNCHVVSSLPAQKAYPSGIPTPIPGKINLIFFDYGGEGVAYHDVDVVHKGPANNERQNEGVDVEGSSSFLKGADVGYVLTDEWIEFTVNVATSGIYDFELPYASKYPCDGEIHLESNSAPITDKLSFSSTLSWENYDTLKTKVALKAGQQVLRLYFDKGGFNFKSMTFANPSGIVHTITPTAGTGGMISPATSVTVKDGDSYPFTITPEPNYKISDVKVNNVSVGALSSYLITNITKDQTIAASFTLLPTYTITAIAPVGGTITPAGATKVSLGGTVTYTITPSQDRQLAFLVIDNNNFFPLTTYSFTGVNTNHTITAKFGININATAGPGGSISPEGNTNAVLGEDAIYDIYPSPGFQISSVIVDGSPLSQPVSSYTFPNVSVTHTIKATFSLVPGFHSISTFSNPWGTITPSGMVGVADGSSQTFTFTPSPGADMTVMIIDSIGFAPQASYTFPNVTEDHTINTLFEPYYYISASTGTGGSISPDGETKYYNGMDVTYNITPDPGYIISNVQVDNIYKGPISSYEFFDITASHTITATFVKAYTITVDQSDGGTIDPAGTMTVIDNSTPKFKIVASPGYLITGTILNGDTTPRNDTSFELSIYNVQQDYTVSARFSEISSLIPVYVITNPGGYLRTSDAVFVSPGLLYAYPGTNLTFQIIENGYNIHVSDIKVNGQSQGSGHYVELKDIRQTQSIDVTFAPDDGYFIINSIATTGGTIDPLGGTAVESGRQSGNYTIKALPGYTISNVYIDGQPQGVIKTYQFPPVTSDHEIRAEFVPAPAYTVTTIAGYGGTMNPSGTTSVADGADLQITSAPNLGYDLKDVIDNNESKGQQYQYNLNDIGMDHVITANFVHTYALSAIAGTGGTISPTGITTVFEGANQTYNITPSAGYTINDVTVDGASQGTITSYPFYNIKSEHIICATFKDPTCLLTSYGAPRSSALPSVKTTYTYAYILGSHDPIANFKDFYIQWDLPNKGLYNFEMHSTTTFYDLKGSIKSQTFASASPAVKLSGSNIGVDGDYYVVMDGSNFVMIDKAGAYAIYFSNSSTPPTNNCNETIPPNYFKIMAPAYSYGTVYPSNIAIASGDNVVVNFTAAANYKITDVKIDDVSKGVLTSYTFNDVKSNHNITVQFTSVCDLLALYKAPSKTALPSVKYTKYSYIYVIGNHAPITKMKDFTLQWDLPNKGLYDFSTNLNVAPWYIDLKTKITYNLAAPSPYVKISNSGIGLDGNYYTVMDGANFVLVEQSGAYAIYFSNSTTTPKSCGSLKDAEFVADIQTSDEEFSAIYPNPVDKNGSITILLSKVAENGALVSIFDLSGKVVYKNILRSTSNSLNFGERLNSGLYIVRIINGNNEYNQKLIIK